MTFMMELLAQPLWLLIWIGWMGTMNSCALLFLSEEPARWVFGSFTLAFLTMVILTEVNGYNRLLGIGHVLFWTPLLVRLYRGGHVFSFGSNYEKWLSLTFVTNAVSLVVDYSDVIRYLSGERS